MSEEEAVTLVQWGKAWFGYVWVGNDTDTRDLIITRFNEQRMVSDAGYYIKRGWQNYDPVVAGGKTYRYSEIAEWAAGQKDGGKESAALFLDWMNGTTILSDLPAPLAALALITHFAEVGRGYSSALGDLEKWIKTLSKASDKGACAKGWRDYRSYYPPALTYKEDVSSEFIV